MGEARRRKLIRDGETNVEAHARLAWEGKRCDGCGSPAVSVAMRSGATVEDLVKHAPDLAAALEVAGVRPFMPHKTFGTKPVVIFKTVFACRACQSALERAAAQHPSWVFVDVARPPKPDRQMVVVPK
jgi:hypothetical protein